jgi:hypothetical protein
VARHNADDEDLSILHGGAAGSPSSSGSPSEVESQRAESNTMHLEEVDPVAAVTKRLGPLVLSVVGAFPDQDLPFYLRQIPVENDRALTPLVFKQLRLEGRLNRFRAEGTTGAFVWRVPPSS